MSVDVAGVIFNDAAVFSVAVGFDPVRFDRRSARELGVRGFDARVENQDTDAVAVGLP